MIKTQGCQHLRGSTKSLPTQRDKGRALEMEAKEKVEVSFSFNHLQYGIKRWPAFEVMNCLFKQEGQNLNVKIISISLKWS